MNRVLLVIMLLLVLCLVSCTESSIDNTPNTSNINHTPTVTVTTTIPPHGTQNPTPTVDTTTSATALPTPEHAPESTSTQTDDITSENLEFYSETPDDLVIIADDAGVILYGYAKGKWITHTEATRYFKKGMVFYQYSIKGFKRSLTAVAIDETYAWYEVSGINPFDFEDGDHGKHYGIKFEGNPKVESGIITNVPPDKIPQTSDVKDSPEVKSRVQSYLEFTFGVNVPNANIVSATQIDLDGDGKDEIMVNANNYIDDYTHEEEPWYSIMFVIKSDNSVHILKEDSYIGANDFELYTGKYFLVMNIDGDSRYEIILDESGYEYYAIYVYSYNGYYHDLQLHTGACS